MNDPEKVSATWVKHLYGLVDELNDTETEMIGMKPKDAIVPGSSSTSEMRELSSRRYICLKMDCIVTYCNLVKNMMTNGTEQLIEYGQREPTD